MHSVIAWAIAASVIAASQSDVVVDAHPAADDTADVADVAAADEDLFALDTEIVQAASRAAEPVRRAPASVTLLSQRELRAFSYDNLADALLGVRGLYVTNDRLWPSLGVRGFNRLGDYGNRVQVQLDGHVLNDDWFFSSYIGPDGMSDLDHVSSVEVVRGPGSALYGSGAFFGVINLVTPTDPPPYLVRASAGATDTSTLRLHVDGGGRIWGDGPTFALSLGALTEPGRDYRSEAYVGTPWAPDGVAQGADAFGASTVNGKLGWDRWTLAFQAHHRNRQLPTGHFATVFGDKRTVVQDERMFAELRYEPALTSWLQLLSRVYVDEQRYDATYAALEPDFPLTDEYEWSVWGGAEARAVARPLALFDGPADALRITAGAQYELHPTSVWHGEYGWDPSTAYTDQSVAFHYLGGYAIGDWEIVPGVIASLGARLDGYLYSGGVDRVNDTEVPVELQWSISPRAALLWLPTDDDTVKLLAGRAARVASVGERTGLPGGIADEAAPTPEGIYTGELEYRRRLPLDTTLILASYLNAITDLVDEDTVANTEAVLWSTGVEGEVRHDLGHGVLAAAQLSWQRTRLDVPLVGDETVNSPEWLAGAWLLCPVLDDRVSIANRVVVDAGRLDRTLRPVEPWLVWDATLTARIDVPVLEGIGGSPAVELMLGLKNILDSRVEHPVASYVRDVTMRQDGRSVRFALRGEF